MAQNSNRSRMSGLRPGPRSYPCREMRGPTQSARCHLFRSGAIAAMPSSEDPRTFSVPYPSDPRAPRPLPCAPPMAVLDDDAQLVDAVGRELASCRREGLRASLLVIEPADVWPPLRPLLAEALAQRLHGRVRGTDRVARVGHQRFAVVLMGAGAAEAAIVHKRLQTVLGGPYRIGDDTLGVTLRIGSAVFRQDGQTAIELLNAARERSGLSMTPGPRCPDNSATA
ncbi:MAG: diguanylate cyclase [Burkholderiales bacterium]|nr:diguanylate cyclase [Burkholderiales bacterium]